MQYARDNLDLDPHWNYCPHCDAEGPFKPVDGLCPECAANRTICEECGETFFRDDLREWNYIDGTKGLVCSTCLAELENELADALAEE